MSLPKKLFEKDIETSASEKASRVYWNKVVEEYGIKKLNEEVDQLILEKKQDKLREGTMNGKHYYSSRNELIDFSAEFMRDLDVEKIKNIKNTDKDKDKLVEEMRYSFSYEVDDEKGESKTVENDNSTNK